MEPFIVPCPGPSAGSLGSCDAWPGCRIMLRISNICAGIIRNARCQPSASSTKNLCDAATLMGPLAAADPNQLLRFHRCRCVSLQ
jgi:hypothetical protein